MSSVKIFENSETVFSTSRELVFCSIFVDGDLLTGSRASATAHWEVVVVGLNSELEKVIFLSNRIFWGYIFCGKKYGNYKNLKLRHSCVHIQCRKNLVKFGKIW